MTFDHLRPVPLRVGMIKTHDDKGAGFVSEPFILSPYEALGQYMHARFVPNGFDGTLEATIEDASVKHSYEPSVSPVTNYLKLNGMDVYDMTVLIKLEHTNKDGQLAYGTVLTVRRLIKVSEHASISERERAQYQGLEGLFKDLDREVLRIVLSDMGLGLGP